MEPRQVYSWGQNAYAELGIGDTSEKHQATLVPFFEGKDPVQVAAGNEHSAILTASGTVYTCGYNDSGQCGVGNTERVRELTAVSGLDKRAERIQSANGCEHLLIATEDGQLYTCGYNARGQLGHGSASIVSEPKRVERLSSARLKVCALACSYYHSVIATDDGQLWGCGRNDFGQLGLGETVADQRSPQPLDMSLFTPQGGGIGHKLGSRARLQVLAIACGQYHSLVAVKGGGLWGFGKNDCGQLGLERFEPCTRPTQITAEPRGLADGLNPLKEPFGGSEVLRVACGYYHSVVVTATGQLFTFGRNDYGQLGLGHRENTWRPHVVSDLLQRRIIDAQCGCYHTIALSADGGVFPFGRNNHGQLGTNNRTDASRPAFVEGLVGKAVCQIAAGFYHTLVLVGPPVLHTLKPPAKTLQSDLRALVNNPARSDVTFLVEGRPLYGHRCILMARCEPLDKMLDGPMKEALDREIRIPDVSFEVFKAFLTFLYTDHVDVAGEDLATATGSRNSEHQHAQQSEASPPLPTPPRNNAAPVSPSRLAGALAGAVPMDESEAGQDRREDTDREESAAFTLDLLSLADQFLVEALKANCEAFLVQSINVSNACCLLQEADARQAPLLRSRVLLFILDNFGLVLASEGWARLPSELIREVSQAVSERGVRVGAAGGGASSMLQC